MSERICIGKQLEQKVAHNDPIEGGVQKEAWGKGRVNYDTWGSYVSKLGEMMAKRGEPVTKDLLLEKLCITQEELDDPDVQFQGMYAFGDYQERVANTAAKEVKAYFAPEITRLETHLDSIKQGFAVADRAEAEKQSQVIQEEISTANNAFRERAGVSEDDTSQHYIDQTLRCLHRDALASGVVISLKEFVDTMVDANLVQDPDFRSELVGNWVHGASEVVRTVLDEYPELQDTDSRKIFVGEEAFETVGYSISGIGKEIREYQKKRWEEIRPIFISEELASMPIITGKGEK